LDRIREDLAHSGGEIDRNEVERGSSARSTGKYAWKVAQNEAKARTSAGDEFGGNRN